MIGTCLLLQVIMVTMNNMALGWTVVSREIGFVLVGSKPGVDAFRVMSNVPQHKKQMWDPFFDMVFTKGVELVCESIPGCLIQIAAFLEAGGDLTTGGTGIALTSILISALAAGFTSAQITFDFDTSPSRRRLDPDFYGMIPDNAQSRTFSFLCLIVMSASTLLGKCLFFYVLSDLGRVNSLGPILIIAFMMIDLAGLIVYKVLRSDFKYWLPVRNNLMRTLLSFVIRTFAKVRLWSYED